MAYRQVQAAVLLILGFGMLGCSGGPADGSPASLREQAPPSPEQPPLNPDQPRNGTEQAPFGSAPSSGSSGIGEVQGACELLCARLDAVECGVSQLLGQIEQRACANDCVLTAQDRLCEAPITELLRCVGQIQNLCLPAGTNPNSNAGLEICLNAIESFNNCEQANEPDDEVAACVSGDACVDCVCRNPIDPSSCAQACLE